MNVDTMNRLEAVEKGLAQTSRQIKHYTIRGNPIASSSPQTPLVILLEHRFL